jgi:hypothetical protein
MKLILCLLFFRWYGWSAEKGVHWIMPIIGAGEAVDY